MIRCQFTLFARFLLLLLLVLCCSTASAQFTQGLPDTLRNGGRSHAIVLSRLCPGAQFTIDVESFVLDTAEIEATLQYFSTPPFSVNYVRTNNGVASITLSPPSFPTGGNLTIQIVIRDVSQTQAVTADTHRGAIRILDKCCDNAALNGAFSAMATSSGPCVPIDYGTAMKFAVDASCSGALSNVGEVSSQSQAGFGRPQFEGASRSALGAFMLYGDPIPNTKQKAWLQTEPVYAGRSYDVVAWVRNIEKTPRSPSPLTNLRMMLVATQRTNVDTLARVENVQYDADPAIAWKELRALYVPALDGDVELSIVVECITPAPIGYGFAIDDISFVPVRTAVNAGSGGQICRGQGGAQLNPIVPPGFTAHWRPANGLADTLSLTPVVSPSVTTAYTLIVRDTFNCVDSGSVTIDVLPADTMSITAVDSVLCGGDSVVLRGEAGLTSYQWFMNSAPLAGGTSDTLLVTVPAVYELRSLSAAGCPLVSNTIVVYQQQPAVVTAIVDTSNLELPLRVGSVVDIPIVVTRILPPFSPQVPIITNVIIEVPPSVLYPDFGFGTQGIGFDSQGPGFARLVTAHTSSYIEFDTVVVSWLVTLGNDAVIPMRAYTQTPAGDCTTDDSSNVWLLPVDICRADGDRLIYAGNPFTPLGVAPLSIAPQPSDDNVRVDAYLLERGRNYLDVVSTTGELVQQMWTDVDTGGIYTFTLSTTHLPSGAYQLILRGPNTTAVSTLRVVH